MSMCYYKFKNASKKFDTIQFEGPVISVLDMKRAVVQQKHLDKNKDDFDLLVTNAQTGERYREDGYLISKNTSLVVRRVPATHTTSMKIRAPLTEESPVVKFQQMMKQSTGSKADDFGGSVFGVEQNNAENAKILAIMNASSAANNPSLSNPRQNLTKFGNGPPPGYVCHRCQQTGHLIRQCPTNGDPKYDLRRIRTPTGIPKSFLKKIEDPNALKDGSKPAGGTVLLHGGELAVAAPNEGEFNRIFEESQRSYRAPRSQESSRARLRAALTCQLCGDFFKKPTTIPCCSTSFCDECIRQALSTDGAFRCPTCFEENVSPDSLRPNGALQRRVQQYLNEHPAGPPVGDPRTVPPKPRPPMRAPSQTAPLPSGHNPNSASAPAPQAEMMSRRDSQRCLRCGGFGHSPSDCLLDPQRPPMRGAPPPWIRRGPPPPMRRMPFPPPFRRMAPPGYGPPPRDPRQPRDPREHGRRRRERSRSPRRRRTRSRSRSRSPRRRSRRR